MMSSSAMWARTNFGLPGCIRALARTPASSPTGSPAWEVINKADHQWVRKMVEASADNLRVVGPVTTIVKEGDAKRVLVEEAKDLGVDCIFVGSTGFSNRLERFLLGSVSAAVANRAECSVEVVR